MWGSQGSHVNKGDSRNDIHCCGSSGIRSMFCVTDLGAVELVIS